MQVPLSTSSGPSNVVVVVVGSSSCTYSKPITITPKLFVVPGITVPLLITTTTAPAPTTTTTAAPQQTTTTAPTTTTAVPQQTTTTAPESTTTTTVEETPETTGSSAETTTSVATEDSVPDPTSTSLVAAALIVDFGGGQPWSAWITGGLVGLMLGAAAMLAAIRKGVLKL